MSLQLPDPRVVARAEAERILRDRDSFLGVPLRRVLADCPGVDRESLLDGLVAFHAERMERVPSRSRYPEAQPWADHVRAIDCELRAAAGMSDLEMALHRSLNAYLAFRGFAKARPAPVEKCRVVYLPDSDNGQVHAKNIDDPAAQWRGMPPAREVPDYGSGLRWDGTGSGLHIDDEPAEIFPLPIHAMCMHHAQDVPGAVDFLNRYSCFWGGQNIVLHDPAKRSVAIEKCSYNFMEVFYPGPDGQSHCSGMACRDAGSPQGAYQSAKRREFLTRMGIPDDCPENAFWTACDVAERLLADGLREMGRRPVLDDLIDLLTTPWPRGLNKPGTRLHPRQPVVEYTLVSHFVLIDRRVYLRWQRDPSTLEFPERPELVAESGSRFESRYAPGAAD